MNQLLPGTGRNESLQRAFDLLELLATMEGGASVAELAQKSGLPRTTVSRLLASLFDAGAVARPGSARKWIVGPTILRLTNAMAPLVLLQARSRNVLERLADDIGETVMLAVPTGPAAARIIAEIPGPKLLAVRDPWAGQTISSPASGFVRQLLAELTPTECERAVDGMELVKLTEKTKTTKMELLGAVEAIRRNDSVLVIDELEEGLSGVGVPVRQDGRLIAMLATYLPTVRLTPTVKERALRSLGRGAAELAIPSDFNMHQVAAR